jgi:hypothetical protein
MAVNTVKTVIGLHVSTHMQLIKVIRTETLNDDAHVVIFMKIIFLGIPIFVSTYLTSHCETVASFIPHEPIYMSSTIGFLKDNDKEC